LARWVEAQREKHALDKITIKHHACLEEVGFTWVVSQPEEESRTEEHQGKQHLPECLFKYDSLNKQQEQYLIIWDTRYKELAEYKRKHNSCNVKELHDKVLCTWVKKQRGQYRRNKLTQDRYDKLSLLQFDFNGQPQFAHNTDMMKGLSKAQHFENRCIQLIEYKRVHGHCDVKVVKADRKRRLPPGVDYGLGDWLCSLNNKYKKGELDQDKYDRLVEIGWTPHVIGLGARSDAQRWELMYETMAQYKNEHGHCDVPNDCQNPKLSTWVQTQRTKYATGKTSKERVEKLLALDFRFTNNERESIWQKQYAALEELKGKHGNCRVKYASNSKEDRSLGRWCQAQRLRHRGLQMNAEEEALLVLLGFDFTIKSRGSSEKQQHLWDLRYTELVAYKQKHGDCIVPIVYKENKELGNWVCSQRKKTQNLCFV